MKSARSFLWRAFVLLATLFSLGKALPDGAPQSACEDGRPRHVTMGDRTPIEPQTGDSPYSFTVEGDVYRPGGNLEVTIEGANDASFQGFFLHARRTSDNVPVDTFTAPDASIGKLLECTNASDTVTHASPRNKTEQTFTWHAPDAGMGEVYFFGTVAGIYDRFFVNITSETLTEGEPVTMGPTTTGEMTTGSAIKLSSGFGFLLLAAVMAMLQINSFA